MNAARWWSAVDEWLVLAHREGVDANLEAAQVIQKRTRSILSRFSHTPGTKTPSPPGMPPATISGRLSASIDADHDGDDALVGPTRSASSKNGPYGRFLEMGGDHEAHNPTGEMWWWEDGFWHHAADLKKAPRSYLYPATVEAMEDGSIRDVYWRRWLWAQEAVTA